MPFGACMCGLCVAQPNVVTKEEWRCRAWAERLGTYDLGFEAGNMGLEIWCLDRAAWKLVGLGR